jgi:hypothetical protein
LRAPRFHPEPGDEVDRARILRLQATSAGSAPGNLSPALCGKDSPVTRITVLLAFAIFGWRTACSAEAQNADKPDERPDLSTSKSAALTWIDASWNGDAHLAHQVLVDDKKQREFIAGLLKFSAAVRALEAAAMKKFGKAGLQVTGYPDGSAKALQAKIKIDEDGDRATVSIDNALLPLQLRRIDGNWRVDCSEASKDPRARRAAAAASAAARIADAVAAEIAAGKFRTVDEAKAAFRERRLAEVEK